MIVAFVGALVVGALVGWCADELLRGRDPRSGRVMVAGILGAIGGLAMRRSMSDDTWLLEVMAVLLGALIVACATRIRISSTAVSRRSA